MKQQRDGTRTFYPAACRADGVVFVDESKYLKDSRFGAVAAATIRRSALVSFIDHWKSARPQGDELKWAGITDSHASRAAIDCIKLVQQYVATGHLHIDVLTWDRNDPRFKDIRRPDDLANLVRMLHHLVVNALDKWDDLLSWDYVPDEQSEIRWRETWRPLDFGLTKKRRERDGPLQSIGEPYPSDSAFHPLIQVADLFAGYGAYVAENSARADRPPTNSNMERQRAPVVKAITDITRSLGYARFNGLATPRDSVINFWPYRSQGEYDRVPVKLPRCIDNQDAEATSNERCSLKGCVEYVTFAQVRFKDKKCPEHLRDAAIEHTEAEMGKQRYDIEQAGEFWCELCNFQRYTKQTAKRRYDEHKNEDRYYCPVHDVQLCSLLDGTGVVPNLPPDLDKRTRYDGKRYPG